MSLQLIGGRIGSCKTIFLIFFRHWAKTSDLFSRSFRRVCQNCILHVFKNNWRKHTFFCKNSKFLHQSRTRSKKTPAFCRKVSVGAVATASHMSSGTLGGRILFWNFFSFSYRFRKLSENFSTYSRKDFVVFVTTASYMSFGIFGGRLFFVKLLVFPFVFGHWAKLFRPFLEFFSSDCHNCILHVLRNVWWKINFL